MTGTTTNDSGRTKLNPAQQALEHALRAHAALLSPPGRRYGTLAALMLDLGRWHTPAPLPAALADWQGPEGACYENAAALADAVPGLRYVEGFADPGLTQPLQLEHAWTIDENGVVHDPTWQVNDRCAYLGIPLTSAYRRGAARRPRRFASPVVLDVYAAPALLEGIPDDAIAEVTPEA